MVLGPAPAWKGGEEEYKALVGGSGLSFQVPAAGALISNGKLDQRPVWMLSNGNSDMPDQGGRSWNPIPRPQPPPPPPPGGGGGGELRLELRFSTCHLAVSDAPHCLTITNTNKYLECSSIVCAILFAPCVSA